MNISQISISRPVLATVMSLVIILLGLVSYNKLSLREYPNIDEPAVTITTRYDGANAEIMETQITNLLEDSISGVEGIRQISSTSRESTSVINVRFNLDRDPDNAAADVRDRVSRVRGALPDEIDEPIVAKVEADAQPIIWVVMRSDELSAAQLTDIADRFMKDQLQTVNGVADVFIFGQRRYAMRVWLDPVKLAAHNVTTQEVETALRNQNIDIPSGRVEGQQREFTVLSETDLNQRSQFENVIVANRNGHFIRLADVARITLGVEDDRVNFRYKQKTAIGLGIVKQAVGNPLTISEGVNALLPKLKHSLPESVQLEVGYDSSIFIRESIKNVYHTLGEATALVALMILFFLRSVRATLVPLVTIPVSLIGAFAIMYALGFTINTLTLLAMVLAIGLVVDDAIVVLENTYRHIEAGMRPFEAAKQSMDEISFAVLAMTITLAAVYVPVAFMEGRTGKLFTEFALTLAGSVIISGFVALTLSPMMCSLLLRKQSNHGTSARGISGMIERFLDGMEKGYQRTLDVMLHGRFVAIPLIAIVLSLAWFISSRLPSELSPIEDRGVVFGILIGPEGATSDYMQAYALQAENAITTIPELDRFGVVTGIGGGRLPVVSQGLSFVRFKDWNERSRNTKAIAQELTGKFMQIPGFLAFAITPASLGSSGFSKPVQFVIKDSTSYHDLNDNVEKFIALLAENPAIVGVDTDLKLNTPQLLVNMDRDRIADLGLTIADAGRTLESLLAGRDVTRFKLDGEEYDVIVKIEEDLRTEPDQLNDIFLRVKDDSLVPLSSVVTLTPTLAARDLNHFDRMRSVTISANLAPGYTLGDALKYMEEKAEKVLPETAQIDYDGQSREFKESSANLYVAFLLALAFIFLVLAAQFESFIDPLIIMITVPMAMLGAVGALWITGNTLNIYSQIGLITLIGLITKHGILMVEFANQIREKDQSVSKHAAILHASALRLRPILMTGTTVILGALPLALAHGAGAESRQQIGWVIVGGMTLGTILTLYVLPCVYTFISRTKRVAH